jgi:translation initiation factor 5
MEQITLGNFDPFARYTRPTIKIKIEGHKTLITNIKDISKSLNSDPQNISKFFSHEVCAQTKYNDKLGNMIINGNYTQPYLTQILNKYIELYVLCEQCNIPEVRLTLNKNKKVIGMCDSCGFCKKYDMDNKDVKHIKNQLLTKI